MTRTRPEWILAATLVDPEPLVIAVGRSPRPLKSIDDVVRGPRRKAIRSAIAAAYEAQHEVDVIYAREGYHVVAEPFLSALGVVHAVRVCAVSTSLEIGTPDGLPERLPTGAWVWDLNRATIMPSAELYDVYCVPEEARKPELSAIEWLSEYANAVRPPDRALTASVTGGHGQSLLDVLSVFRFDGALREMRTAMRIQQSGSQRWLLGVTCDVTAGDAAAMPTLSFAESVINAEMSARKGTSTAVVDLRSMLPVLWVSDPPDAVQWRRTGHPEHDPAVHPDDVPELLRIGRDVLSGPVSGQLRVRGVDRSWVAVEYSAVLMEQLHDQGVSAAMVKFRPVPSTAAVQGIPQLPDSASNEGRVEPR